MAKYRVLLSFMIGFLSSLFSLPALAAEDLVKLPSISEYVAKHPDHKAPDGWEWGAVKTGGGFMRYGMVHPKGAKFVVLMVVGINNFGEMYYKFANDIVDMGGAVWLTESDNWTAPVNARGQKIANWDSIATPGRPFDKSVADLDVVVRKMREETKKRAGGKNIPIYASGISLGGLMLVYYMHNHPNNDFKDVFLASPSLVVKLPYPRWVVRLLVWGAQTIGMGKKYALGYGSRAALLAKDALPVKTILGLASADDLDRAKWLVLYEHEKKNYRTSGYSYDVAGYFLDTYDKMTSAGYMESITNSVYVSFGTADQINNVEESAKLFKRVPNLKKLLVQDGQRHQIYDCSDKYLLPWMEIIKGVVTGKTEKI